MTPGASDMTASRFLICFAVFVVVGLAVGWRSLDYDWHWDDLHLIRPHSASELAGTFRGTWDPDSVETQGFRPLTAIFNDLRARLFGEWVLGHRLFLIGLFSAYLVGLGWLACRLGGAWWAGLSAGIVTLCAKGSFYHFLWIADGIHLLPALLFVGATHLLFGYLDGGRRVLAASSVLLMLAALASREDAVVLYAAAPLLGYAYLSLTARPDEARGRLIGFTVLLFLTWVLFWAWRSTVVPGAPNVPLHLGLLGGPLKLFLWTLCLSGQSGLAQYGFRGLGIVLVILACRLPRGERRHALLWLGLAAVACLPGAAYARANLMLFPVSFYAMFASLAVAAASRTSAAATACGLARSAGQGGQRRPPYSPGLAAGLALLVAVAGASASASQLVQLSMHERSSDKVFHDWIAVYSKFRFKSIPPERLQRTKASLARFGLVNSTFDFDAWQQQLTERGRVGFIDDGELFVPEQHFLAH